MKKLPINEIICGDCLSVMKDWPDECIDLVVTSPPYNLGNNHHTSTYRHKSYNDNKLEHLYQNEQKNVLDILFRICSGDCFYNHQHRIKKGYLIKPDKWLDFTCWRIKQEIVWHRGSPNMDDIRFYPFTERIYWLTQEQSDTEFRNCLNLTDDWHIEPVGTSEEHKRQFPLEIPYRCIVSTNADIILDPYCGSGTTCVAAKMLGRKYIGIDISEKYCEISRQRLEACDTGVPVKEQRKGQMALFKKE